MSEAEGNPPVEYRPVDGFPGYRVGDDGSVWSQRTRNGKHTSAWRRLKTATRSGQQHDGTPLPPYRRVVLYANEKSVKRLVHRLVLETFVGPCPVGQQSRHLNGNPEDNRLANLLWGTRHENHLDRIKHGTYPCGEKNPFAKLTTSDVIEIRRRRSTGERCAPIAKDFNTTAAYISMLYLKKSWTHI